MAPRRALIVDVYHSGDRGRPWPPFLFVPAKASVPAHPQEPKSSWSFWKRMPLEAIAASPEQAAKDLTEAGYHIQ